MQIKKHAEKHSAKPGVNVAISVVFATRNRATQLQQTLAAYHKLDTEGLAWELIVVDNNSSDDTDRVLEAASARLPLKRLFVSEAGQNRARNEALSEVDGELVVFTDDDVLPDPDCLKAYQAASRRWPDEAIFGARIDPSFPEEAPAWMQDARFGFSSTAFARYAPAEQESCVERHPYGPSFAIRQAALGEERFPVHLGPQTGAYAMGGEGDFLRRIAADKYNYVYVPSARVQHVVRPEQTTAEWLFNRAQKKGRGQVYLPTAKKRRRLLVFGVSIRLWLAVGRAWVRFRLSSLSSEPRDHIRQGIKFQLRWGQAQELLDRHRGARLLEHKKN